jgi:putative ABC transport system permease protein
MILQSIRMAFKAITANKMRSFLTVLGVVIGVIAVVVLIAIAQGTTSSVTSSIEQLGTNLLTVNIRTYRNNPITMDVLDQLAQDPSIGSIATVISQSVTAKAGTITYTDGTVEATVPGYDSIRNLTVSAGRFLKQPDLDNRSYVAVVGVDVADELFGTRNVLGEKVRINGYDFTIVGVLTEKGSTTTGSSDSRIIIPFTLGQRILFQPGIRTFYASASSSETVTMAEAVLTSYLDNAFDNKTNAYSIFNQSDMLATISDTTQTLTLMLGGIAGISLLVGGIGIMNIMLVSVSERTREIGIRKAIGAARSNILMQFLIEALVVSGLGGLLGLLIAVGLMGVLSTALSMTLTMSPVVAELAIGFSLLIGVVFGMYPANKASKLRPIEALRYDG